MVKNLPTLITTPRPDLAKLARQYGFLVGARSDKLKAYLKMREEVEFMDWNFHNPMTIKTLSLYTKYAKIFRPKYAVAPDIMREKDLDKILDFANNLSKYVENVIVVPKVPVIDRIGRKFILGFSVPTQYGATPLPVWEFFEHRVHLLGGTPRQQAKYYKIFPKVISIDGNSIYKAATQFGKYFTKSGWHYLEPTILNGFRVEEAYRRSLLNLRMFWLEVVNNDKN